MNPLLGPLAFFLDATLGFPDFSPEFVNGQICVCNSLSDVTRQESSSIVPELQLLQDGEMHVETIGTIEGWSDSGRDESVRKLE